MDDQSTLSSPYGFVGTGRYDEQPTLSSPYHSFVTSGPYGWPDAWHLVGKSQMVELARVI